MVNYARFLIHTETHSDTDRKFSEKLFSDIRQEHHEAKEKIILDLPDTKEVLFETESSLNDYDILGEIDFTDNGSWAIYFLDTDEEGFQKPDCFGNVEFKEIPLDEIPTGKYIQSYGCEAFFSIPKQRFSRITGIKEKDIGVRKLTDKDIDMPKLIPDKLYEALKNKITGFNALESDRKYAYICAEIGKEFTRGELLGIIKALCETPDQNLAFFNFGNPNTQILVNEDLKSYMQYEDIRQNIFTFYRATKKK